MEAPPVLSPGRPAFHVGRVIGCMLAGIALVALVIAAVLFWMASGVDHSNVSFDLSPDGRQIVFSSADGDLYLYTLGSAAATRLTNTPDLVGRSPAFAPDGSRIVFSGHDRNGSRSSIYVVSTSGGPVHPVTSGTSWDSAPRYSRDGKRIVFARAYRHRPYSMGGWTWDDYDICVVSSSGSGLVRLTNLAYYGAGSPGFIDNDRSVVFSAEAGGTPTELARVMWKVGLKQGATPRELLPGLNRPYHGGAFADDPAADRLQSRIAFISDRREPFAYDVWTSNADGTVARGLGITTIARYNQNPIFTPDGKHVLFLAGTKTGAGSRAVFSLWEVGVDGKGARQLADSELFTDPKKWRLIR